MKNVEMCFAKDSYLGETRFVRYQPTRQPYTNLNSNFRDVFMYVAQNDNGNYPDYPGQFDLAYAGLEDAARSNGEYYSDTAGTYVVVICMHARIHGNRALSRL